MTLAQKIKQVLNNELEPENIKTLIEMAEFLKFKESEKKWNEIKEYESEYITEGERDRLEEVKAKGEFIDQDKLLKELGINEDEIQN